ncbi:unnamed protein product, partial [Trichogramma brassicae]
PIIVESAVLVAAILYLDEPTLLAFSIGLYAIKSRVLSRSECVLVLPTAVCRITKQASKYSCMLAIFLQCKPLENQEAVSRLLLTFDPGSRTKQRERQKICRNPRAAVHSQRYDNTLSALCPACLTTMEDAEHAFFHCSRCHEERERLQRVLHEVIEPESIVRLMLETAGNWMAVSSFAQSAVSRLRQEAQDM